MFCQFIKFIKNVVTIMNSLKILFLTETYIKNLKILKNINVFCQINVRILLKFMPFCFKQLFGNAFCPILISPKII